jgi:type II secretory pathway component PulF
MKFHFKAFDQTGALRSGEIVATTKEGALVALQSQGLVVTYIAPAEFRLKIPFFERVSIKELASFTRSLHFLIKARIPLDEAIRALSEQIQNEKFKETLQTVYKDVLSGVPLSRGLANHPDVFSAYYVKMVQIGEISGTLDEISDYLATHLETQNKFSGKVVQALIYPAIVFVIFIGTMITLFTMIVPRIAQIFKDNNIQMPLITKTFESLAMFLIHNWLYIIVGLITGIYLVIEYLRTPEGRLFLFQVLPRLPILGNISQMIYLARFTESLSFLMKGGIPVSESLNVVAESMDNPVYETVLKEVAEETRKGSPISSALMSWREFFPPLVIRSVLTGEKTGKLKDILFSTSQYYFQELDLKTSTVSEILQPILVIILAAGLGLLEASLLIPILTLTKAVQTF